MSIERRNFLVKAGLVAGGIALAGVPLPGHAETHATVAEREVLAVVSQYGRSVGREQTSSESVGLTVKMQNREAFAQVYIDGKKLPFEKVFADGNVLRFTHQGVEFSLDHVA